MTTPLESLCSKILDHEISQSEDNLTNIIQRDMLLGAYHNCYGDLMLDSNEMYWRLVSDGEEFSRNPNDNNHIRLIVTIRQAMKYLRFKEDYERQESYLGLKEDRLIQCRFAYSRLYQLMTQVFVLIHELRAIDILLSLKG